MPVSEKTKKEARSARGWLNKIFPRKKKTKKEASNTISGTVDRIRSRREEQERMLKELGM